MTAKLFLTCTDRKQNENLELRVGEAVPQEE